ncbi:MAG TPA: plasmid pRiA4b ORF-3 family protein, partial [Spirochaetes bacterium]|nr:plasmid pRiA4b ORF-3 family protein [Spirochaetota bacterium]
MIYKLKITLLDHEPKIWRIVEVKSSIGLLELHAVIQTAMGWTNSHLHHFIK